MPCNGETTGIRPPISPPHEAGFVGIPAAGRLAALMLLSGGPARVVAHLRMRCLARHPILGTGGLGGRPSALRAARRLAATVH